MAKLKKISMFLFFPSPSHQKKILTIDDHVGVSIAGLTADARTISRWMRNECLK